MAALASPNTEITEKSVFKALKYAGENYFDHKKALEDIEEDYNRISDKARQEFNEVKDTIDQKFHDKQMVNQELFESSMKKKTDTVQFEKRRKCTDEEIKLIEMACEGKDISAEEMENIKFALGFKAKNKKRYKFKKPLMALVGQTKAGKSSLLNSLLRERVVPQKVMKQTARVTYITYSERKFVAELENNKLIHIELDVDVKDQDVDLKFEDRIDPNKVNVEIRVGRPNLVLQNGFDIVDSPGLNENSALNNLCKKMEKSLLPLLIYVIDGRNGLTQTDVDDIKKINENSPELTILYFVTKLDRSKYDKKIYDMRKKENGVSTDKDLDGESDLDVAKRRLQNVFDKLTSHCFVDKKISMENCEEFNGANLWSVNEMRIKKDSNSPPQKEIDRFNLKLIETFEERLMSYLKFMLEQPLINSVKVLVAFLESSLEKASIVASKIAGEKLEKRNCLNVFRENEQKLFQEQLQFMKSKLKEEISQLIEENYHKFSDIFSQNQSLYESNDPGRVIQTSLNLELQDLVDKFMSSSDEHLKERLRQLVRRLKNGKYGCPSFETMLKNRLLFEYDQNEENLSISTMSRNNPKIRKEFANKMELFANCIARGMESLRRSNQSNLSTIDREILLSEIIQNITKEFEEKHKSFGKELNSHKKLLEEIFEVGDKEKACVRLFAEKLSVHFAKALEVKTPLLLNINYRRKSECVGKGGQANVLLIYLANKENPIIKKEYFIKGCKDRDSDNKEIKNQSIQMKYAIGSDQDTKRLINFGMEIYYSSRLDHERFLKLLGVHLASNSTFSVYYDYLPLGSMKAYLMDYFKKPEDKRSKPLALKDRLRFSIHVAEGLQHLHNLDIVHRDIKLTNILVRDPGSDLPNEAVICDYGLTKSFGFIDDSYKTGTVLYMAPELFNKEFGKKQSYSHAVDVYSFGISLWQLLGYCLTAEEEYQNYQAKFAGDCENGDYETLSKLILDGHRPETDTRDAIPKILRNLMEKCWEKKPEMRPSFVKPLKEIYLGCDPNDHMKDKTILDVLKECYDNM